MSADDLCDDADVLIYSKYAVTYLPIPTTILYILSSMPSGPVPSPSA